MNNLIFEKFKSVINSLESSKVPFHYFIVSFFTIILFRILLESFSSYTTSGIRILSFLHITLSFIFIALSLILFFNLVTKEKIGKISQIILGAFPIVLLAPILDLILSLGKGYPIKYLSTSSLSEFFTNYLTFFGGFSNGITPGLKIELFLIIILGFFYFIIKKIKLLKSLMLSIGTYTILYLLFNIRIIIKWLNELIQLDIKTDLLYSYVYLILIFILLIFLFYRTNKIKFFSIVKDIRPYRLIHYELMFVLGIVLSLTSFLDVYLVIQGIIIMISILLFWLFSVMTNNISDYEIDKISNSNRPLAKKEFEFNEYKNLAWIFLIIGIIYSSTVSFVILFTTVLFVGNYFIYSMPPIRFKRVTFFSKLTISINSLLLLYSGIYLINESHVTEIPIGLILYFLILLTAAINFIDIKDYRGDKHANIKTLPVILGLKKSKFIIGLFFFISSLGIYFLLNETLLIIPLLILGMFQFFLINRTKYNEKHILITNNISLVLLIIYLLL